MVVRLFLHSPQKKNSRSETKDNPEIMTSLELEIIKYMGKDYYLQNKDTIINKGIYELKILGVKKELIKYFIPEDILQTYNEINSFPEKSSENEIKTSDIRREELNKFLKHLDIEEFIKEQTSQNNKIDLESNDDYFLSFPWEIWLKENINKKPYLLRNVLVSKTPKVKDNSNILFCLSHAFINPDGTEYYKVANDFYEEITHVLSFFLEKRQENNRKSKIFQISRFLNSESIKELDYEKFSILHFIAHGEPGKFGLEKKDNHWKLDWTENKKIIDLLNQKSSEFKLVFFSSCYSGFGTHKYNSLAFESVYSVYHFIQSDLMEK